MSLMRPTGDDRNNERTAPNDRIDERTAPNDRIDEPPPEYYVLGERSIGNAVVDRLRAQDRHARLIDVGTMAEAERSDALCPDALDDAGLDGRSTVVVATRSDPRNLLLAQQVSTRFDVDRLLVLVHDPPRLESFAAAGHEPVCATTALSEAVIDEL